VVFDKEELKKLIKEKGIGSTEDLNSFLRDVTKEVVEALYDGELTDHLGHDKHQKSESGNVRNGFSKKTVQTKSGEVDLEVPRDRDGSFDPQIVKKRQRDITGIQDKVISMFGLGMSTRDIQIHIDEIYGQSLSPETISTITDSVLERAKEWQNRPLQPVYPIIFLDALVIKLRQERVVKNAVLYGVIGISLDGRKECLGLYLSKDPESSRFWLSVMNELKNRGVQDVLIFSVDNLAGISEAIEAAFTHSDIQKCVVHQIRNSLKHVPWKERKTVAADLRTIYTADTEEMALLNLEDFEGRWNGKYPHISRSWRKNWSELSTFFKYSPPMRKLIYTTNPIESFNRSLRKVSKNRPVFQTEDSVIKLFYLATMNLQKKWTQKNRDWGSIYSQLMIQFSERLEQYL
jgi:putative transposase